MDFGERRRRPAHFFIFFNFTPFFSPISWYPILSCLIATTPVRARERRRMKVISPPIHNSTKPHCFLTQRASNPEASRTNVSEETPCTRQPWLARTAPGPPRESLVRNETRISLPAKPSLTRTTLCQLCVAPQSSRSRPADKAFIELTVCRSWMRVLSPSTTSFLSSLLLGYGYT